MGSLPQELQADDQGRTLGDEAADSREEESLEVGDQVVVVVSMRSGQRCILRCEAANTAAGTSTILAK